MIVMKTKLIHFFLFLDLHILVPETPVYESLIAVILL